MERFTQPGQASVQDARVTVISRIWATLRPMMAAALIFTPPSRQTFALPITIATGATVSTIVIWRASGRRNRSTSGESIQHLEQRIANLEVIAGSEELDWQNRLQPGQSSPQQTTADTITR